MKKSYIIVGGLIATLLIIFYVVVLMPTKIALVHFRDSQMAEVAKVNDNWFIQPEQIDLKTDDFSGITDYPAIYLFHISTLSSEQKANLQKAMENGSKVHVLSATSKENDLSNIAGDDLDYIMKCFDNHGAENVKRWLNYSRKVFDDQSLFVDEITDPITYAKDVFYRIGNVAFEDLDDYWKYYKEQGLYKEGKPRVAILNINANPQTIFRSYQDSIILNMEARGYNVAAISGRYKKLSNLKKFQPNMVMSFPHGRLDMRKGDDVVEWLKENDILLLTPQLVHQTYEEWDNDQQGMSGSIFGQNVVVPELDGAIQPFAVAAEYMNKQGFHTYKPIPGRINKFCETADRWLALKDKANKDKKVTIFYYKGPGQNALVGGGLEVGISMFNVLTQMKAQGYDLGDLPKDYDTFIQRIYTEGPILGEYAQGTFNKFLKEGNPAWISTEEYDAWCKQELDPESYAEVKAAYGEAPGDYYTTIKDGKKYLAIPRVQFGNVSLLPVLSAALGVNEFKAIHGVKKAPPHAYIASYLWPRMKEKVDAIIHFGTHGSVEFTPWKQVLLSQKDWPEVLITPIPHLYIYTIDNIGEAMMAKRRTYATMVSHLTESYSTADLYDELDEISRVLGNFDAVPDGDVKELLRDKIRAFADTLDLEKDLGITKVMVKEMSDETAGLIENYVNHLGKEKITMGLHTFGVSYSDKEIYETVKMMSVDPLTQSIRELDKTAGTKGFYLSKYNKTSGVRKEGYDDIALRMITDVLDKGYTTQKIMTPKAFDTIEELENEYGAPKASVISDYYGGAYAKKKKKEAPSKSKEEMVYNPVTHKMVPKSSLKPQKVTDDAAKGWTMHVAASRNTAYGIDIIKDEESFEEISSLLDPATLHKFSNAGKLDANIQAQVDIINNKTFNKLVKYLQNEEKRTMILKWLAEEQTQNRIAGYRSSIDSRIIKKISSGTYVDDFLSAYKSKNYKNVVAKYDRKKSKTVNSNIQYILDKKASIIAAETSNSNLTAIIAILKSEGAQKQLQSNIAILENRILEIAMEEKQLLAALLMMQESIEAVQEYNENLKASPKMEIGALLNGLKGGYVAPSSGGDPISNPLATPTGKNLYSINEQVTPTKEAFEIGRNMAEQILQKHISKHGEYPKKIAYSLWGGEFIRNQGLNIGQIMYMLGVEPVRNQRGRVYDVKLIPMSELQRPRIDVVVQTSGQFRDIAASRIYLINKAIKLASEAEDDGEYRNYVKEGTAQAEASMKDKGMSPAEARKFSTVRVFGGVNGNYGTNIMGLVEQGDKWETEEEIAERYIQNMGSMYAEGSWSEFREGMFETMLENTEVVVHPRSSNVTGPISLDHVYEFMGGITASVRVTTGKDPDGYFNDFRNKYDPTVQGLKEAIWSETRTQLFNPKYIKAQMEEGESAAEVFAENFRDTYGWNVMKPAAIDKEIWEGYYDIYVKDKKNLGTVEFFKNKNPYALQEMTAVMLETVRKGYWKPSDAVKKDIAKLHAELIKDNKAGCSGFVCDNAKLREMIKGLLSDELKESYSQEIANVRTGETADNNSESVVLKKEEIKTLSEIIQDNQKAIISLVIAILLFGGAITWGIVKRRREQ
ncbi:cobaltochelatase subunit CobN [Flammeovirga agarivorans]|uniref:CobN/magnesium chelatase domain-containing protein n=1 Tax=Flammeovirga agarivorans TaxID=2726742 RepID=A0A7X8SJW3_9BACT|nr:cobaltochelatase subunit CobN [Flammeovirga agarivorans]NLR91478.1 hypothetical protein [Flammeovirga agarivorans]